MIVSEKVVFPSQKELKEKLDYNPKTGEFRWIEPPKRHPRLKGKVAGCRRPGTKGDAYIYIKVNGVAYGAHRLAWMWVHGSLPPVVDHINREGCDNRLQNLRGCSHGENMRNHSKRVGKSGLPTGVRKAQSGRYVARITYEGRLRTIGTFKTVEEAENAYLSERKKLFGKFNPITK